MSLTKEALAAAIKQLLEPEGQCCIMYPVNEWEAWQETALQHGLAAQRLVHIKPAPAKAANRIVGFLGHKPVSLQETELIIYQQPQVYSPAFRQLLRPFLSPSLNNPIDLNNNRHCFAAMPVVYIF